MTIEKWLSDVYYDEYGTHIWNKEDSDGGSQLVADVRGWGRLQNEFKAEEEAAKFQDEIGRFIVEAIREKIARTSSQTEISDEEYYKGVYYQKQVMNPYPTGEQSYTAYEKGFMDFAKWYREQLKKKQ